MNRLFILLYIFLLLGFAHSPLMGQNQSLLQGNNTFQILQSDASGMEIQMSLGDLKVQEVNYPEGSFIRLHGDGLLPSPEEGKPELLMWSRLFELPFNADVEIKVLEKKEQVLDLKSLGIQQSITPHLLSAAKKEGQEVRFELDESIYKTNSFYGNLYQSEYLGVMRHLNIASLRIVPVAYNPVSQQLRVITHLKIKVSFVGGSVTKTFAHKQKYYAPAFEMLSGELINGQVFAFVPPVAQQAAERMLIVTDSNNRKTLKPFVLMKERQGFDVKLAFTQNTSVGSTKTAIKNYIQSEYNSTTPPTYVILVGDVAQIQAWPGQSATTHITDLYYFEYTNDDFPELFYGRFSCEDTTELHNIIEKTLLYEQLTMPDYNYMDTSVLIAGHDNTYGPTHGNGQVNYGINEYFNSSNGIVSKSYLYPSSSSADAQIRADASAGAALLNYSAHGNYNGWSDPSFKNNDVANMTNINKYPVMIGNACLTGTFDYNDCFGEVLTNAPKKGAVAYIGASDNTYWDEDYYWAVGYGNIVANPTFATTGAGIFDGMFHTHNEPYSEWSLSLAQIINKGNMAVVQGGSRVKYYWEVYHCFGDPSLVYYQKKPTPQAPLHNSLLPIGSNSFSVIAEPFALVALSKSDTLVTSIYADSLGNALLNFNPFTTVGQAVLSVTAQNKIPYLDTISILTPNSPYLHMISHQINDSLGNDDNLINYNERIYLGLSLTNLTSFSTGQVDVSISIQDSSLTLIDSIQHVQLFQGYDTLSLYNAFELQIKPVVLNQKTIKVDVEIVDSAGGQWQYFFYMTLNAPELHLGEMIMDDSSFGDGDGYADPGETLILSIPASNIGVGDLLNGIATLSPQNNTVSTSITPVNLNQIKTDTGYILEYTVVVSASAANGAFCPMDLSLSASGYQASQKYFIVVGKIDEDFETGDFTRYNWLSSGSTPWIIDNSEYYQGSHSAKSGIIGNNSTSAMNITMNVLKDDTISFFVKVSTELGYDYLTFKIDNVLMEDWSGNKTWQYVAFPVHKGVHTFTWEYEKDGSSTGGSDAVWLDNIIFPMTDVLSGIETNTVETNQLSVYPNPAQDYLSLRLQSGELSSKASVQFYTLQGKLVQEVKLSELKQSASGVFRMDIQALHSGTYMLIIQDESQRIVRPVVKM
jgi:hypothetical protein